MKIRRKKKRNSTNNSMTEGVDKNIGKNGFKFVNNKLLEIKLE